MRIPLDEVVFFDVITTHPTTGAVIDADSTPTFDVFEEDTDTGILAAQNMTKRTSKTGNYRGSFTASAANGFDVGKWYNAVASATVSTVAGKVAALTFMLVPAETSAGVPKVDQQAILGTTLTETSGGLIAAAFKKFFDKATPTGTINSIPDAVPGANGGLPTTDGTKVNQTVTLTAASVQAIWDALTSALTTVGSIGKWILDKLDVVLSTRLATSSYTVPPTAVQNRTEMDTNSTKLAAAALEASVQTLTTTVGVAGAGLTAADDAVMTRIGALGAGLTALGDTRLANLDAAVTSRMATYTQPPGFLAATFPSDPADQSLIIDATTAIINAVGAIQSLSSAQAQAAAAAALTAFGASTATNVTSAQTVITNAIAALQNLAAGAAMTLTAGERTAIANALLDLTDSIEVGLTLRQVQRLVAAIAAGKISGADGTLMAIRNALADSKDRIVATVDSSGNRLAVTLDVS